MLMLQLRGVMVGLLGIFNIGSWDGRDFLWGGYMRFVRDFFYIFFNISDL